MVATVDGINDPVTGAAYCKRRMELCEMRAEEAMQKGDLILVAKFEGHLFAWTELLQKYLRESYQEGKTSEELTVALSKPIEKKTRYNAKPRRDSKGTRGEATGESGAVGADSATGSMGVEEPIRMATHGIAFGKSPNNNELQPPEWEIDHPVGENIALSHYAPKQSDTHSGGTG